MTDVTTAIAPVASTLEGEFRIGMAFSRTFTLLRRNFPIYFAIGAVAAAPALLFQKAGALLSDDTGAWAMLGGLLMLLLGPITQAITLHVAFQDMRGRPVSLIEAVRAAFGRLLPLIGLFICMGLAIAVGALLFIVPALVLMTMWYVAISACIVERLGVFASMERSSALTKGHRWAIFGTWLLLLITGAILASVLESVLGLSGSAGVVKAGSLAWSGFLTAFGTVFSVVVYHDLRVAKEGVDTRQIAAVFE
jgi:hypothetical protein